MPDNPFAEASTARRFVRTYGHRNVQVLAKRADGTLWAVERGSYRGDEVNLLVPAGDYGWNPVPGYDESVGGDGSRAHLPSPRSRGRRCSSCASTPTAASSP